MEENTMEHSLAWELTEALKKQLKHQNILIIILVVLLFATNIGWLIYEQSFETVVESQGTYFTESSEITQTIN